MNLCLLALLVSASAFASSVGKPRDPASLHETPDIPLAAREDIRLAVLDSFISYWNTHMQVAGDLQSTFLRHSGAKAKREFGVLFKDAGAAPVISREGHTIYLDFERARSVINWPDLSIPKFSLGGVNVVYDPSLSVAENQRRFDERLTPTRKSAANSWRLNWLPEAEAAIATKVFEFLSKVPGAAGVKKVSEACGAHELCKWTRDLAILSVAIPNAEDFGCVIVSYNSTALNHIPFCREWAKRREADKSERYATVVDAVKRDPNLEWVAHDQQCPVLDDKGQAAFESDMRLVKHIGENDFQEQGQWYYFVGKVTKGHLVEGTIYASKADSKSTDSTKLPIAALHFDPASKTTQIASIELANNRAVDNPLSSKMMTIDIKDADQPGYRDDFANMQFLAESAQGWFTTCQKLAFAAKFDPTEAKKSAQEMMSQPVVPVSGASDAKK